MARVDDAAGTVVVRQRLDPHPSSVSQARRLVTAALDDLGRTELVDDAALVVSELVTNALVHAGTPMEVVVSQRDAEVVIEVVDDSPRLPFRRHHAELAGTGRGLRLVEQLTTAWGARERPPGKAVWFLLAPRAAPEAAGLEDDLGGDLAGDLAGDLDADLDALLAAFPEEAGSTEAPESLDTESEVLEVVLLQVPLLLHAAWQMQAESVLREYLLTRLSGGDDDVERELETHAAVHEAVVLLQEHVPAPDLGEHPEELMAAAVEPFASAERLLFPVPTASIHHFELMDATLDDAMRLAEAGALLTPPTQPEVREFRRWLCREVREQRTGGTPQPWSPDVGPDLPAMVRAPEWDPREVSTAIGPLVAAADTNRIVAVEPGRDPAAGIHLGRRADRPAPRGHHPAPVPAGAPGRVHASPLRGPQAAAGAPGDRAGPAPGRQRGGRPAARRGGVAAGRAARLPGRAR